MKTIKEFLATPFGAAATAFLRVFAAAAIGAWYSAGFPISELTGAEIESYIRVGLGAACALVGVNAVGPWERRYGLHQDDPRSKATDQ